MIRKREFLKPPHNDSLGRSHPLHRSLDFAAISELDP